MAGEHADAERRRASREALYVRQDRVLPVAAADAAAPLHDGDRVWSGVHTRRVLAEVAVDRFTAAGNNGPPASQRSGRPRPPGATVFAVCRRRQPDNARLARVNAAGACRCTSPSAPRPIA